MPVLDLTPLYWMYFGLATAVGLGAIGAVLLVLAALWLWLIAPPRRS